MKGNVVSQRKSLIYTLKVDETRRFQLSLTSDPFVSSQGEGTRSYKCCARALDMARWPVFLLMLAKSLQAIPLLDCTQLKTCVESTTVPGEKPCSRYGCGAVAY